MDRRTLTVRQKKEKKIKIQSIAQLVARSGMKPTSITPASIKPAVTSGIQGSLLYNEALNHQQIIKMPRPQQDS